MGSIDGTFAQRVKYNPREALIEAEEMITLAPENATAWYLKGMALSELNRYEEALKSFEQTTRLRPDLPEGWQGKGASLLKLQQYDKALAALEKGPHTYLTFYQKGCALSSLGRYNEAMDAIQESIRLNSDDRDVLDHSRSLLDDIGKRRQAAKAAEETAKHPEAAKASDDASKRPRAAKATEEPVKRAEPAKPNEEAGTLKPDHTSPHTYNSPS